MPMLLQVRVLLSGPASYSSVCLAVEAGAADYPAVLGCSAQPLVSSDLLGDTRSCLLDTAAGGQAVTLTPP